MQDDKTSVVIVGGGPVGLGLAIELAQRGVASIVVERDAEPAPIPKGQNLTQRTMEHFIAWGIEKDIRAARVLPDNYPIAGLTFYRNLMSGYSHPWHRRALVDKFYFTSNERLPQYETERVLRSRAALLDNIDLRIGWQATGIAQRNGGVVVDIESTGGDRKAVNGKFVVGCDGSRSLVRAQAGIDWITRDHDKRMALLLFKSTDLHRKLTPFGDVSYYNVITPELDGYWRFFGRIDVGEGFFFHAPVPDDTSRENFDFHALLNESVGARIDAEIEYIGFWDLRLAVASTYRAGRVFIAGDAAHGHPPYGGFGINLGFEDARNLGWKIAAYLARWGGDRLLDSYSDERLPVFQSTADEFIFRYIEEDRAFMRCHDPARDEAAFETAWQSRVKAAEADIASYEPHYDGSPVIAGKDKGKSGANGVHEFRARAGHHLAPHALADGRSVHQALGSDFALLAIDAEESCVDAFVTAAAELDVPLTIVRDGAANRYAAALVLVRPDHYVAWCGDTAPDDAAVLLSQVTGNRQP